MGEKLKVLVTASTFPRFNGDSTPRFILDLCRSLEATGECGCTVLAPHGNGSAVLEELEGVKVRRYRYMFPSSLEKLSKGSIVSTIKRNRLVVLLVPFFLAGQFLATVSEMRRLRPDVVLANWIVPQGIVAALAKVFMPHMKIIMVSLGGDSAFIQGNLVYRGIGRFALSKADMIVAVSGFIRERLSAVAGIGKELITVVPMGADDSLFAASSIGRGDGKSLLFVGRLEEKKGVFYLIEAMKRVLQRYPDAVLKIVGDGTQRERLERLTSEKGLSERVTFAGAVEHSRLPLLFAESTVFVAPSVNLDDDVEGLPVILLESIASGVPVVTTDAGGITDIIEDRVTGVLVPQRDAERLALGIMELLDDGKLREEISQRALARLRELFIWDAVAKKYLAVIDEVCGRHRGEIR